MKRKAKPQPPPWYAAIVKKHTPPRPLAAHCLAAFAGGGLLCALAQSAQYLLILRHIPEQTASTIVVLATVALAALFTGLNIYDAAAQRLGAGLAVPITGFANSLAAAMLEHKNEGYVLGSGCNSFKLAGAVVVFGLVSALTLSLAALLLGLL
ncbi:MAG: SpoVA/SpoVAEb family sporulation membrane protein [Firmicutes bacterium]|nr:SpoVA/SpoVAEb family sporulation membrane protein [Bacillota bacterium]